MTWDSPRRPSTSLGVARARSSRTLVLESLEDRQLLSSSRSFPFTDIRFGGALYEIAVIGPGAVQAHGTGHGTVAINLLGTTQDSQVTVSVLFTHASPVVKRLAIDHINVRSGHLGSIQGLTTADLMGRITPLQGPLASLQFDAIGPNAQIDVSGNLGQLTVNQGVNLGPSGHLRVSNDLTGAFSVGGNVALDGGQIAFGRDLTGQFTVGGDLTLLNGGQFNVGRDLGSASGTGAKIAGNVILSSGGDLSVGREVYSLAVGGSIDTSTGGEVQVFGDLKNLTVNGFIQGKGTNDIVVGLDLSQLVVLGGGDNLGGVRGANIAVGKNIQGLDVRYGIFNSLVTAGILIDGGTPGAGSNGWNIGPDGPVAVLDSEIRAGTLIRNLTIGGDVKSDVPTIPSARPTRIVAGEDAQGNFSAGGIIDNFQIIGKLIDSVLAASVQPHGGTGAVATTSTSASDDNGYKTYDKPAGTISVGVVGNSTTTLNFTAPPYDPTGDPTIDDWVLPRGSINPSFAPHPLTTSPSPSAGTTLPLPSKSTVLGGVISTSHGDSADFAGIFAANTSGVLVGALPP
jgi:hypothetical protein